MKLSITVKLSALVTVFLLFTFFGLALNTHPVLAEACNSPGGVDGIIQVPEGEDPVAFCGEAGVDDGSLSVDGIRTTASCQVEDSSFFGLPTWYKYLDGAETGQGFCEPEFIKQGTELDIPATASAIGFAVFEIILRIAGMLAVFFVIYGGIQYVLSQGEPDKIKGARTTIINALAGAVVAVVAVAVVNLVAGSIAGTAGGVGGTNLPGASADSVAIGRALDIVFGIAGAIAVIMVMLGGFQYVISQGNPQNTAKAKNVILYALIGLAVIIFASVIVNFVLGSV